MQNADVEINAVDLSKTGSYTSYIPLSRQCLVMSAQVFQNVKIDTVKLSLVLWSKFVTTFQRLKPSHFIFQLL